jgi:hypothetical protein
MELSLLYFTHLFMFLGIAHSLNYCLKTGVHYRVQKTQRDLHQGKPAFPACKVVKLWKSGDYAANLKFDNGTKACRLLTTPGFRSGGTESS